MAERAPLMVVLGEYSAVISRTCMFSIGGSVRADGLHREASCVLLARTPSAEHGLVSPNKQMLRKRTSLIVHIFRDVHLTFEKNLVLTHLTTRHSDPDMTETFLALQKHLASNNIHIPIRGRKSKYSIPDAIEIGQGLMAESDSVVSESEEAVDTPEDITLEDVTVDLD